MRTINKTRYAILGMLNEQQRSGYEIKSLMVRSTAYFWRESDSTIYPMLKVLAQEGKARSEMVSVGKKKKEIFSITELGRAEFKAWLDGPTAGETSRNEFLLKLFFVTENREMIQLFQERLEKSEKTYEDFELIGARLENQPDSFLKTVRLKSLKYGMAQLNLEITWLKEGISDVHR